MPHATRRHAGNPSSATNNSAAPSRPNGHAPTADGHGGRLAASSPPPAAAIALRVPRTRCGPIAISLWFDGPMAVTDLAAALAEANLSSPMLPENRGDPYGIYRFI